MEDVSNATFDRDWRKSLDMREHCICDLYTMDYIGLLIFVIIIYNIQILVVIIANSIHLYLESQLNSNHVEVDQRLLKLERTKTNR